MSSLLGGTSAMCPAVEPDFGALVISLDFELHWGVRDRVRPDGAYGRNLMGARNAVPRMLALFAEYGVAATWATVGFLFARSREERERFQPPVLPAYRSTRLDPYRERTGETEEDDPLHYAASLIEQIRDTPKQEVGTHTYSHYYCLEPGQTREAFAADLRSASTIAACYGIPLRSIVFPRNQPNLAYASALREAGIVCYRGSDNGWIYRARNRREENFVVRGARWLDNHIGLSGPRLASWNGVVQPDGLSNVPSTMFLRPCSTRTLDRLRLERIRGAMEAAAVRKEIFHLWWHPHNFGVRTSENLEFLRAILEIFARFRDSHGLRSLSMMQVAEAAQKLQIRATAA